MAGKGDYPKFRNCLLGNEQQTDLPDRFRAFLTSSAAEVLALLRGSEDYGTSNILASHACLFRACIMGIKFLLEEYQADRTNAGTPLARRS